MSERDCVVAAEFSYRPRVKYGKPQFFVKLGSNSVAFSSDLQSFGLVKYHHILVVWDENSKEILYITAESNPLDGPDVIYLGQFSPDGHATILSSKLLDQGEVFFCAACQVVRRYLGLDVVQAPLTGAETEVLSIIPDICNARFPEWQEDKGSKALVDMIMASVVSEAS